MKSPTRISAHVEPVPGEEYRFWVSSSVYGRPPHLTDIVAGLGRGTCSCEDFQMVKHKMRKEGEMDPIVTSCRHIRLARLFWASQELIKIAAERLEKYGPEDCGE